jgi:hypothetical protein
MEAVHRYEGTVNQVMGDGIMALFGAPLAHEDHAVRACYAALRMQESVRNYADEVRRSHAAVVKIRVGLNSGEVVVRAIGSDVRMDYTAVGQTTHLAARMEQIADPGAIVITPNTLTMAEGYVEVRSLGPVPVKGDAGGVGRPRRGAGIGVPSRRAASGRHTDCPGGAGGGSAAGGPGGARPARAIARRHRGPSRPPRGRYRGGALWPGHDPGRGAGPAPARRPLPISGSASSTGEQASSRRPASTSPPPRRCAARWTCGSIWTRRRQRQRRWHDAGALQ